MRTHKLLTPFILLLPAILGILAALALQSTASLNPIYAAQFRVDLGTMLLISGLSVSLGALLGWAIYRWYYLQRETHVSQMQNKVLSDRRRFLRQLDHELKNPLTALRMELAFLADENSPEEVMKVFADMSIQVDRISRLVTDLRKLAQLEEQQLTATPVVLGEILEEVIEAVEDHPNFSERQVRLNLLTHPLPLPPVSGDRGLLWLACFNLLDNALKFSPPGAEVEVRAFEISPWVVLEVADNGPGISAVDLPYIFEELYRGENARGQPGSGLGLALVRTIIALHGGNIAVRSQPGQGTIFTMRLPSSS